MKQYTTPEQTTKLIELGFEKPKSIEVYREGHCVPFVEQQWMYSIGELIEMLPDVINILHRAILKIEIRGLKWHVKYEGDRGLEYLTYNSQLIDALYDMIVKLKDEELL
jgi:hypothetical protein